MAHPKAKVMAFHIITDGSSIEIPYDSQKPMPTMKNAVNGRLISCALLNLKRRHTCGTNPTVVKAPPMNPSSSFHSKLCLLLLALGYSISCLSNHRPVANYSIQSEDSLFSPYTP